MWMPFFLNNDHVFPRGLQCLSLAWGMNHLQDDSQGQAKNYLGCNRNMSKSKGWTLQGSLLKLWMDENASQQSNKNR